MRLEANDTFFLFPCCPSLFEEVVFTEETFINASDISSTEFTDGWLLILADCC